MMLPTMIPKGAKVLLTGASGFLGAHIYDRLKRDGFIVHTIGRSTFTSDKHIVCNLGSEVPDLEGESYQWIVHSAGKAHVVPRSIGEKEDFFRVNQRGLEHLFKAIDSSQTKPSHITLISTVAVYGVQSGLGISENHPLAAEDPYGKSKRLAEEIAVRYAEQADSKLTILRLPLIAGINPPGNLGSMIGAMKSGRYFGIGKSAARRSIVLASDIAEQLSKLSEVGGVFNLTDGVDVSFRSLEQSMSEALNLALPRRIPFFMAWMAALVGEVLQFVGIHFPINFSVLRKLTTDLTFSSTKALEAGWAPESALANTKNWIE